jgi:iron complex outermembrane receptor protein
MSIDGHAGRMLQRMEEHVKSLSWGLLALAASTTPALAQNTNPAKAEEVVVTATRFEGPEREAPIGVSIITREEIERSAVTTLPELISLQPGFGVRNLDGRPDFQLDLGGFGITGDQNTLVLVDGQRYSEIDLSSPRLSAIPLSTIERIEIIQGSGAVLYGSGASGGVINIITRSPQPGEREATIFGGVGSYHTHDVRLGGNAGSDRVGLGLNGSYYESDNYRDNNSIRQQQADATLATRLGAMQLVAKAATYDQDLRLPGPRTREELITDRRGTATADDASSQRGNRAGVTASTLLGPAEVAVDFGYRDKTAKTNFASQLFYTDAESDVYTVSPRVKVPHRIWGLDNALVAGLDGEQWNYHNTSAASPTTVSSPFSLTELERRSVAGYLQYRSGITSSTQVTVGGRVQNVTTDLSDAVSLLSQTQTREVHAYELALRQDLGSSLRLWGKLGQSFRFATVDEEQFTSPPGLLEPQVSHDQQLGLEYEARTTRARATLFRSNVNNEIAFAPLFGFCCNTNLPPTLHRGIELEASQRARSWLQLSANYTYTQAQFRQGIFSGVNVAGNEIPLVPRNKANVGAMLNLTPRFWVRADLQYVGSQRFDNDQTNRAQLMPAYRVVNLSTGYELDHWRFELIVRNLFNADYFTYAIVSLTNPASGEFNALPAPERSLFASVRYRFH